MSFQSHTYAISIKRGVGASQIGVVSAASVRFFDAFPLKSRSELRAYVEASSRGTTHVIWGIGKDLTWL